MTLNRVILKRSKGGTVLTLLSKGLLCSRGFLRVEWGDWKFRDMVRKVHEKGVDAECSTEG